MTQPNQQSQQDDTMQTRARALLNAMNHRDYRSAGAHFDSAMSSLLPATKVEELWTAIVTKEGPFVELSSARTVEEEGPPTVALLCKFATGSAELYVSFNKEADIAGLHVGPPPAKAPAKAAAKAPAEAPAEAPDEASSPAAAKPAD